MVFGALAAFWLLPEIRKSLWLLALLLGGSAIYAGFTVYSLILFSNMLIAPQTPLLYEGKIVQKIHHPPGGRNHHHKYRITLDSTDEYGFDLHFNISEQQYKQLRMGMNYRREMTRGGLGIAYRLRW